MLKTNNFRQIMKWIYYKNSSNTARYALGQYKKVEGKTLLCVGINPSTATPNYLDSTLKKVVSLATTNNYANWIMLNIYPQRATNPNGLHHHIDDRLHRKNLQIIKRILGKFVNADIMFAYGNLIDKRDYLQRCKSDFAKTIRASRFTGNTFCVKMTAKGNPAHPLYLSANSALQEYTI